MQRSLSSPFAALVQGQWLDGLVLALAVIAIFATPLQMLRLATDLPEPARLLAAGAFAALAATAIWLKAGPLSRTMLHLVDKGLNLPLWLIVLIGLGLRLGWIALFPAQPASDGAVYLGLAGKLSAGASYETGGTQAYWPVGYPLFLSVWLMLIGNGQTAYLLANLFLFVVGLFGVAHLGKTLAGPAGGHLAALLLAIWPNLVTLSATPEKELLVVALLPWATSVIVRVLKTPEQDWPALIAGLLLGAGTLVQPSLQFLPIVGAILFLGMSATLRSGALRTLLLLLGAAVVVAPWTIRNYEVLDEFVLVATNGGSVLYRANNPLATGAYVARGEVDLSHLDEVARDHAARRLALDWIRQNPGRFLSLAIEKQILFMGDDAVGVYTTLKVGKGSDDPRTYALLKATSNAWWMLAWASIAVLVLAARRQRASLPILARAPIWLWLYLFALHSIFESAGKYHVAVLWVPCVVFGVLAAALLETDRRAWAQ